MSAPSTAVASSSSVSVPLTDAQAAQSPPPLSGASSAAPPAASPAQPAAAAPSDGDSGCQLASANGDYATLKVAVPLTLELLYRVPGTKTCDLPRAAVCVRLQGRKADPASMVSFFIGDTVFYAAVSSSGSATNVCARCGVILAAIVEGTAASLVVLNVADVTPRANSPSLRVGTVSAVVTAALREYEPERSAPAGSTAAAVSASSADSSASAASNASSLDDALDALSSCVALVPFARVHSPAQYTADVLPRVDTFLQRLSAEQYQRLLARLPAEVCAADWASVARRAFVELRTLWHDRESFAARTQSQVHWGRIIELVHSWRPESSGASKPTVTAEPQRTRSRRGSPARAQSRTASGSRRSPRLAAVETTPSKRRQSSTIAAAPPRRSRPRTTARAASSAAADAQATTADGHGDSDAAPATDSERSDGSNGSDGDGDSSDGDGGSSCVDAADDVEPWRERVLALERENAVLKERLSSQAQLYEERQRSALLMGLLSALPQSQHLAAQVAQLAPPTLRSFLPAAPPPTSLVGYDAPAPGHVGALYQPQQPQQPQQSQQLPLQHAQAHLLAAQHPHSSPQPAPSHFSAQYAPPPSSLQQHQPQSYVPQVGGQTPPLASFSWQQQPPSSLTSSALQHTLLTPQTHVHQHLPGGASPSGVQLPQISTPSSFSQSSA